jgi:hypothetical protein
MKLSQKNKMILTEVKRRINQFKVPKGKDTKIRDV